MRYQPPKRRLTISSSADANKPVQMRSGRIPSFHRPTAANTTAARPKRNAMNGFIRQGYHGHSIFELVV